MKRTIILITVVALMSACNTSKDEIPCTCNEIKDKRFIDNGQPQLISQLYVKDCETGVLTWVDVTDEEFANNYAGDCWELD